MNFAQIVFEIVILTLAIGALLFGSVGLAAVARHFLHWRFEPPPDEPPTPRAAVLIGISLFVFLGGLVLVVLFHYQSPGLAVVAFVSALAPLALVLAVRRAHRGHVVATAPQGHVRIGGVAMAGPIGMVLARAIPPGSALEGVMAVFAIVVVSAGATLGLVAAVASWRRAWA